MPRGPGGFPRRAGPSDRASAPRRGTSASRAARTHPQLPEERPFFAILPFARPRKHVPAPPLDRDRNLRTPRVRLPGGGARLPRTAPRDRARPAGALALGGPRGDRAPRRGDRAAARRRAEAAPPLGEAHRLAGVDLDGPPLPPARAAPRDGRPALARGRGGLCRAVRGAHAGRGGG